MRAILIENQEALARAVAALPAAPPLPARTVLVPSERHAHALRRALARRGRAEVLAGTRLLGPLTAAQEVLRAAGVPFSPGEEALRPARLLALFREDLPLEHFPRDLLRSARGWDRALAAAIGELEAAGLSPADLPAHVARARDLALLWSRLEAEAGPSRSAARIHLEAARLLSREPRAWPFDGAVLALATGHEDVALARFLAAVPDVTLALRPARPLGTRFLARVERLYGAEARRALAGPAPRATGEEAPPVATERDLLAAHLFADAPPLDAPARPRSAGPDGTVDLEEHAGVEAELEATASWVARQVLERRRPLEDVAVLVPAQDPLVSLVAERLARLAPADGEALPVFVAGGLPAAGEAGGARLLAVLRALASHLSAETLAPVLAALRLAGEPARGHLTHGEAMELAYGLGTVGGNAARPEGALEWSARAAAREGELEAALRRPQTDEDSAERERRRLERMLRNLRAVRPALDALVEVARAVVGGAPLAALRDALLAFVPHVRLPGEGAAIPARLAESLAPACAGALGARLRGEDALEVVGEHLRALRLPRGRFGEPAVYVGTVEGAAGLDFAAVRVIGLCEGVLPAAPREDPVLPGRLRDALGALPGPEDRVAAQLHALVAAVRGARDAVALSAPRVDLARTEREPASLFVDAAAALARPDAATGAAAEPVPGTAALERDYFRPAGAAAAAFRAAWPVSASGWLDRVARVAPELPPEWDRDPALDLAGVDARRAPPPRLGAGDGVLGPGEPFPAIPGLTPARPISASGLRDLVQCPRMFLMRRILGWQEPAAAPSLRELDALAYGNLLHRVVELFYREHGRAFVAGERSLPHWQALARAVADRAFDAFLSEHPLVGEGVRAEERERLHESVRAFLAYDWGAPRRRHVGVELGFGVPEPLPLPAGGATLHVTGYIDRVDVEGEVTLVRDLKSGKAHPRVGEEAGPTPFRDVQLGLYQLAAQALAPRWGTPRRVEVAYAYAHGRSAVEERAFRGGEAAVLERATRTWLATAAELLSGRAFTPTPEEEDCTYCPFRPLCGDAAARRARAGLAEEEDGPLGRFRALRGVEEDDA